jgi:2-polyprenyl-6-methoxyphenol hydroxylase-like FAD-dependent oxidoreductase
VLSRTTDVRWPMGGNRFRWSFELYDWEMAAGARRKERVHAPWWTDSEATEAQVDELITSRAPWFQAETRRVAWASAVRFERRLAERLVEGRMALVGDAAHLASPLGVHSMNSGLQEGAALAAVLRRMLRDDAPSSDLLEWQSHFQSRWRQLHHGDTPPRARRGADDWVRNNASRILSSLPSSGEELSKLLWQAGLVAPVPGSPTTAGSIA